MLGAIIGDIVGAPYEFKNLKSEDFPLFSQVPFFTDDTVMTIATAEALLSNRDYGAQYHQYGNRYRGRGYGGMFLNWLDSDNPMPYGSFGNGSAMRVSPIGFFFQNREEVWREAEKTALPTHNHPEGIKGAVAVADAIFLIRAGLDNRELLDEIQRRYYRVNLDLKWVRETNQFDETCQGTVAIAFTAYFCSDGFEDCIRKAVSLGGDSDTIAAIAGSLAEARYGINQALVNEVFSYLKPEFLETIKNFYRVSKLW
jgi:ADP-ribosyl-[dinitrogen reductase] hydrolase